MSLYEDSLAALKRETDARAAMLKVAEGELQILERLARFLSTRGWQARPEAPTHPVTGITLALWINVPDARARGALLEQLLALAIAVTRNERLDLGDVTAYVLTLADGVQVQLRVGMPATLKAAA